ncbi:unnamed protein product [Rotaria magnacalcarata]|uniref:WWE domain-containing protein n=1 Tax=Rotaria magnacalcarata TaxID=392030 RepID=A0A816LPN7_9BILA|nr:unnamed protein product [Rotaria magnacalcarata]
MSANITTATISNKKKPLWFYQSNQNPFDPNETKEWELYSEFENEYIEEAYQQKELEVHLQNYVIDFKRGIQYTMNDTNKQKPVKREVVNTSQYIRTERFSYPDRANRSFIPYGDYFSPFIEHWRNRNQALFKSQDEPNWSTIVEQARKVRFIAFYLRLFNHSLFL